jgi:cyanophycin synthetase
LTMRSVPARGRVVIVKRVVNDNAVHQNEQVRDGLAPAIVGTARNAAAAIAVRLAGVDIITRDPSRPLEETGGVVLEVNTTPGLFHHYQRAGEPAAVAVPILAALLGMLAPGQGGPPAGAEGHPVRSRGRSRVPVGASAETPLP